MHTVLPPSVDRRYLLKASASLSLAAFASVTIWPRPGACQTGLVEGYADGDGARLFFVKRGEGQLMLFLHGLPDSWAIFRSQLAEFGRDVIGKQLQRLQQMFVRCGFELRTWFRGNVGARFVRCKPALIPPPLVSWCRTDLGPSDVRFRASVLSLGATAS